MTVELDNPVVVFLIGLRINKILKLHKWYPVYSAMSKMIKELPHTPETGYLSGHMWYGRTTIMTQYWDSFDSLENYARNRDHTHMPAWQRFNLKTGAGTDVGLWHETYEILPGHFECIYHNMPKFGLGKVGKLVAAEGPYASARKRLQHSKTAQS